MFPSALTRERYSRLTVKDDGVGFDTGKVRAGSLGLNIVRTMVQDKLHGSLKIRSGEKGTEVSFDFSTKQQTLSAFQSEHERKG